MNPWEAAVEPKAFNENIFFEQIIFFFGDKALPGPWYSDITWRNLTLEFTTNIKLFAIVLT